MVHVERRGKWWLVVKDNEQLGMFAHPIDAHRFALSMLHDGLAEGVTLLSGVIVEP